MAKKIDRYIGQSSVKIDGMENFLSFIDSVGETKKMKKEIIREVKPIMKDKMRDEMMSMKSSSKVHRKKPKNEIKSPPIKWGIRSAPSGAVLVKSGVRQDKSMPNGGRTFASNIINIIDNSKQNRRVTRKGQNRGILKRVTMFTTPYNRNKDGVGKAATKAINRFYTDSSRRNGGSEI